MNNLYEYLICKSNIPNNEYLVTPTNRFASFAISLNQARKGIWIPFNTLSLLYILIHILWPFRPS